MDSKRKEIEFVLVEIDEPPPQELDFEAWLADALVNLWQKQCDQCNTKD